MTENNDSNAPKTGSIFDVKWNETDEVPTITEYRSLCVPALLALLCGLLSPLVLISWGFVFVPIFALVLSFWSLFSIERSDGMKFGRPLVWIAVFLSLCFVVLNISLWESYKSRMIREAMEFGAGYFELIAREKDDPEIDILNIRDMRAPYWQRSVAPSENRWKALEKDMFAQEDLPTTTNDQCLRTLMALAQNAKATYYMTDQYYYDSKNIDHVRLTYAITYDNDANEKETFFVQLAVKRIRGEDPATVGGKKKKMAGWCVESLKGPVLPKGFNGDT